MEYQERNKEIIRTSVVGIAANVLLAGFKAVVGAIAGSVAIIMDAVNNLSDALSSVITIVGTKLSARPADDKHPFGYGRIEYFSAIVISIIVLIAGVSSLIESVKKIFNPTEPNYTTFTARRHRCCNTCKARAWTLCQSERQETAKRLTYSLRR